MLFDQKLGSAGGKPILKKLAVSKLIELKESLNFDIWQIRSAQSKKFTSWQCHFSRSFKRRINYLFISNSMQKSAKSVKILNFPLFCFLLNLGNISIGSGLWKFRNSLISNNIFVDEMKTLIQKVIFSFKNDTYVTD